MATIPRIVAQRSLDPGGAVQIPTGDQVGAALEQAGTKGVSLISHYQDRVYQQERFEATNLVDQFSANIEGQKLPVLQESKPGAIGYHDDMLKKYDEQVDGFISTVPESQRADVQARLRVKRQLLSNEVAATELKANTDYQVTTIGNRAETAKQGILQAGPDSIGAYQKDVEELIDASTLRADQKEAAKLKTRQALQETGYLALMQRDPKAAQNVAAGWGVGGGIGTVVDRIVGAESGGNDAARNPNSTATGAGQFIDSTWLSSIKKYRPDLMEGRSEAEVLALRSNGALSREMTRNYAVENATALQAAGITPTAGNVYLAHFLGPAGAKKVLSASPDAPVEGLVDAGAVAANKSILAGKSASQVAAWAATKMGAENKPVAVAAVDNRFSAIPTDRRLALAGNADTALNQQNAALAAQQTADYNNRLNALQTNVIDGRATAADVQQARQEGWLRDAGDIQKVLGQIASRDKGLADVQNFGKAFSDPAYPWNPVDKDQKDWADAGFKSLGGNMPALQTVAEKTGIVPASAAVAMRGALVNPNAQVVQNALQTAANLVGGRYPDIFAGVDNGKELTEAGLTFRHLVYDRGMSAEAATKQIMEQRTPEYEQKVKAKIKSEDMNEVVKKNLKDTDIRSAFDDSWIPFNDPKLTYSPAMRVRAMGDYEEVFREKYASNGNVELSKKLALEDMKRTWGFTEVNGSKTVIKFPPERSAAYAGIENPADQIALQAVAVIKDWNGADVDRSKIRLDEVKKTGERWTKGQPPTYLLSYADKNGQMQVVPNQFFADAAQMRDAQTSKRAAQSAKIQAVTNINADMADLDRANFGVR